MTRRVLVILGIVALAAVLAYTLGAVRALKAVGSATGLYCTVTPSENDNGKSCFITQVEQPKITQADAATIRHGYAIRNIAVQCSWRNSNGNSHGLYACTYGPTAKHLEQDFYYDGTRCKLVIETSSGRNVIAHKSLNACKGGS